MNVLKGQIKVNGRASFRGSGGLDIPLAWAPTAGDGRPVTIGMRPEHLRIADDGFPVEVAVVEPTGSEVQVVSRAPGGEEIVAVFRERHLFKPGETIRLSPDPAFVHLFDGETGQRVAR
jgi:multiple sugar transport system ATP-binding protein